MKQSTYVWLARCCNAEQLYLKWEKTSEIQRKCEKKKNVAEITPDRGFLGENWKCFGTRAGRAPGWPITGRDGWRILEFLDIDGKRCRIGLSGLGCGDVRLKASIR